MNPLPFVGAGAGIAQAIVGAINTRKQNKKLENMVNSYQPNKSILDYYNKALSRYNVNPYETNMYQQQKQNANRSLTTGLSVLNRGRGGLGGVASLVQGSNDAMLKAAAAAEGQQGQNLSQLGQATEMKAAEDFKPFEMKYNLTAQKAAANAQLMNAGLSNIFHGTGMVSQNAAMDKEFGTGRIGKAASSRKLSGLGNTAIRMSQPY